MQPTKGRIVLFHSWRLGVEIAALVVAASPDGREVNLVTFSEDGSVSAELEVPELDATEDDLAEIGQHWRAWDAACDEARAAGVSPPLAPEVPGRSWRWPPRAPDAGSKG